MSSITIISDAPNCGVTYDGQSDDRNSYIIQATVHDDARVLPLFHYCWGQCYKTFLSVIYGFLY